MSTDFLNIEHKWDGAYILKAPRGKLHALEECSGGFRGKHKKIYNLENIHVNTFLFSRLFTPLHEYQT